MSDEWKYKELPRASGKIAPAQWNPETGEWEVFTGLAKVQDTDVKAELEQIKQQQQQILQRLDDGVDTRLTGSIVEEVIFERQIYTAGTLTANPPVVPPAWATKAIVKFRIYGITGNISGISLNSAYYTPLLVDLFRLSTNTKSPIRVGHIFGESELGDLTIAGDDKKAFLTKLLPREGIRIYVTINGQFSAGEGVDLEVRVSWM